MATFKVNDVVRVINDISQVHSLQESHGGWSDDMALVRMCVCVYLKLSNINNALILEIFNCRIAINFAKTIIDTL